ncbi:hypothetical protein [Streptomyces sp. NPDC088748]|uniref:hypothetical protein n=1 Tax=Streptomyces sp. NPDC088748 TaxID=3365887 RepID=UPI003824B6BB
MVAAAPARVLHVPPATTARISPVVGLHVFGLAVIATVAGITPGALLLATVARSLRPPGNSECAYLTKDVPYVQTTHPR